MYEIRPESAKTFITDRNISLPRFQRKQTWDEKKNFQLCISVFKGYPLGVCIVNVEKEDSKIKKFLLDGRQRRNALMQMYENPENIGIWANKFIGLRSITDPLEFEEKCKEKINEYLENDEEDNVEELASIVDDDIEDTEDNTDEETDEDPDTDTNTISNGDLSLLIDIIKQTYKQSKHYSTFTSPFDYVKYFDELPYVDCNVKNGYKINGKKLKQFLIEYRTECENMDLSYTEKSDLFAEYLLKRCKIKSNINDQKVKNEIKNRWNHILEKFDIIEKIDNVVSDCKIGIIEVKGFKPADSQKIFNIINSEGVKLTAVEILSAKSYWNKKIENPSSELFEEAKDLYDKMGIKISDVYRWDVPATLLSRLGSNVIFKPLSWDSVKNKAEFEKKLTLGFKIMAGIYQGGITKEDIDELGKASSKWSFSTESLVTELNTIIRLIEGISYFQYLKTWKTTIMELTSDAVALDYILLLYFDWKRKGMPIGSSTKTNIFQKNCFILWDKLIYEYVKKNWLGASDAKIRKNIQDLNNEQEMFIPIDKQKWIDLLQDILDHSKIEETNVSLALMKPILYHMYCLNEIQGPMELNCHIEVDHIVPQYLFKSSTLINKEILQDNLYNLGLMPKKDNISKSNLKLIEITDPWLKNQITKYEFIPEDLFAEYSDVNKYGNLFKFRKQKFDEAFTTKRDNCLNN